jgi:hypothetical protein
MIITLGSPPFNGWRRLGCKRLWQFSHIHFNNLPKKKEIKNRLVKISVQTATLLKLISTLSALFIVQILHCWLPFISSFIHISN